MPKSKTVIVGIDRTQELSELGGHVHVYLNEEAKRNLGGMIEEVRNDPGETWLRTYKVHDVQVMVNGVRIVPEMWGSCTVSIDFPAEMVVSRNGDSGGKKVVVRREVIED